MPSAKAGQQQSREIRQRACAAVAALGIALVLISTVIISLAFVGIALNAFIIEPVIRVMLFVLAAFMAAEVFLVARYRKELPFTRIR